MANIDKFTEQKGLFLKADDVQKNPGTVFKITGEGMLNKSEKFQVERLHIPGTFGADEKTFDCSKTNARTIKDALGDDTLKWIGAELTLETYRTKTSDGKMTDAINVKQVKKP